jgi:hypothetical protein
LAANPLPGHALCFAGVGYDDLDMALYQFMPKAQRVVVEAEIQARREALGLLGLEVEGDSEVGTNGTEVDSNDNATIETPRL